MITSEMKLFYEKYDQIKQYNVSKIWPFEV